MEFEFYPLSEEESANLKRHDKDTSDLLCKLFNAEWGINDIIEMLNENLDSPDEKPLDMEVFSNLCEHAKNTYQAFCMSEEKDVLISALRAFRNLVLVSQIPLGYDESYEVVNFFATLMVAAIVEIADALQFSKRPDPNKIIAHGYGDIDIWYDFDEDTPEKVYNRIREHLEN